MTAPCTVPASHSAAHGRRERRRVVLAAAFGTGVLSLTGAGVYAALTASASNITAQQVTSGTLSLTMAAETGAASLSDAVANLAPGDVVRRHVALTSGGTLAGSGLGLSVASDVTNPLTDNLTVAVTGCSVAWNPTEGSCAGTSTALLAPTALTDLGTRTVFAGPVDPAVGEVVHLQVSLALADVTETVVNGVVAADSVQGRTAGLTYTFSVDQRAATPTSS